MHLDLGPCLLRPYRREDAEPYSQLANDRSVWINVRDRFPHPYTLADAEQWIAGMLTGAVGALNFVIDVDGAAGGCVGLTRQEDVYRQSAELGYWLGKPYRGRGIVTAAVRAVTELAFTRFELHRVFAEVFEWNPASMRVLEKAGFQLEGRLRQAVFKDGRSGDALIYGRIRE